MPEKERRKEKKKEGKKDHRDTLIRFDSQ